MPKATILFADNDPDFLRTRSEFLEQEGYLVVPAADPTEARRKLEVGGIDLAILDIRLVDDDDEKDVSGLTLAKEVARTVPKIILTGFPSYEYVREALRPQLDGLPAAVGFVAKQEGTEALLDAIGRAPAAPRVEEGFGGGVQAQRKLWPLIIAFASLVLATGMGIGAAVTGVFWLLLGTFLFAFLMAACILVWVFME